MQKMHTTSNATFPHMMWCFPWHSMQRHVEVMDRPSLQLAYMRLLTLHATLAHKAIEMVEE